MSANPLDIRLFCRHDQHVICMTRAALKLIAFAIWTCTGCVSFAIAQDTTPQPKVEYLTYEQVLQRWETSRSDGDSRDLRTFARDMNRVWGATQSFTAAYRDNPWLRFYAHCEQIFGDTTDFVLFVAVLGILYAACRFVPVHRMSAMTSQGSIALSPRDSVFCGVRGWLLFLCIWTTILWPLFTFSTLYRMSEEWMYLFTGLMIFAIISGIMLWRAIPVGLVLVRTFLIVVAGLNFLSVFLYGEANPNKVPLALLQGAIPVVWLLYTYQSRRVRATLDPSSSSL